MKISQTSASFKKEMLAATRTKKILIILLVFLGLSVFDPLMLRGMSELINMMNESGVYEQMGMDVSTLTEALNSSSAAGAVTFISDVSQVGLLVLILILNSLAGGEQKKRSIIMPLSSGLKEFNYVFPKFIIYPVISLIASFLAMLLASVVSIAVFETNDISTPEVLLSGILLGVQIMLYVCIHLCMGISMGRPGASAAITIGLSFMLPNLFAVLQLKSVYNPFAISQMAMSFVYGETAFTAAEVIFTVLIALLIMVLLCIVTLMAQKAKRIDNSGNEILI